LKYILSWEAERNSKIFKYLSCAAYIKEWGGPKEGERPSAYIIILGDKEISLNIDCDHGIASQSILLGATEIGLGAYIIHSVTGEKLRSELKIENKYETLILLNWDRQSNRHLF